MQQDFLSQLSEVAVIPRISGLCYIADYVAPSEASALMAQIDAQEWNTDLRRRVQHYGYRYDYQARAITAESSLGALPLWLDQWAQRLTMEGFFETRPGQVIVNDYQPGQGIAPHIDCIPCFGRTIASLSLGSDCVMQFSNPETGDREEIILEERSLIILSGEARYGWTHGIPARKSDIVNGVRKGRGRRISLTFRTVAVNPSNHLRA